MSENPEPGDEALDFIRERLTIYDLAVRADGELVDIISGNVMKKNHVRLMIKNDYRDSGKTGLTGRALDAVINFMLGCVRKSAMEAISEGRYTHTVPVTDDLM